MRCRGPGYAALGSGALAAAWLVTADPSRGPAALALEAEGRYRVLGETALRAHDRVEPTRLRARTEVELRLTRGFTWRGTLGLRAFRDWALDRSRYSGAAREQQGSEVELRELTLGMGLGPVDLVLGRRQVAWGALYGQFVADRVMPFDLRDFLLPEADFIRRPLWMVGALATGEPWSAEAILILERRADRLPAPGSEFFVVSGALMAGGAGPGEDLDPSRVALAEAEPGLRLGVRLKGVDVSVFGLAAHPDIDPLATGGELGERDAVLGALAAAAFGPYALRGEAALERDRPVASGGTEDIARAGFVIDRALPRAQLVSLQGVHETETVSGAGGARTEIAFRWSSDPAGGPFVAGVEYHQGFDGDWLLRPRASYAIGALWLAEWGIDWFGGAADSYYGQFDGRDRVTFTITRAGRWGTDGQHEPRSQPAGEGGSSR